jgi:hypothetical protein
MRRTQTVLGTQYLNDGPVSLPTLPFSQALKGFEDRAREAFDELDDRLQNVMVYQAFEEFPTDLDELNEAFQLPPARLSDDDSARRRYSFHALPIA